MKKKKPKTPLQKIWWFIWEDESVWSYIVNIILAFVLIKFLIYPGLGLMLGTTHPVVAVVSGSMEHPGSFDEWWKSKCSINNVIFSQEELYINTGISKETFKEYSFKNGFNTGDLMVLKRASNLKRGDIIVFYSNGNNEPIIHRIISIKEEAGTKYYTTKGDHNCGTSSAEEDIPQDSLIGEAILRVPYLGMLKLGFVKLLQIFGAS